MKAEEAGKDMGTGNPETEGKGKERAVIEDPNVQQEEDKESVVPLANAISIGLTDLILTSSYSLIQLLLPH
jgi:hypothetical protein